MRYGVTKSGYMSHIVVFGNNALCCFKHNIVRIFESEEPPNMACNHCLHMAGLARNANKIKGVQP
jgi:hypothetical protein